MKRATYFLLSIFLIISHLAFAQDKSAYEKRVYVNSENDSLLYRILLPENYDKSKSYPVILYLHGAGERGNDNEFQLYHGWQVFLNDSVRQKYPAIVVLPQCPKDDSWSSGVYRILNKESYFEIPARVLPTKSLLLANELVDYIVKTEAANSNRLYIMGLSMGGFGTFESLSNYPDKYAAAMPICGGGSLRDTERYAKNTALWIFHGSDDTTVSPEFSRQLYKELKSKGADVRYTEYPGVGHGSWRNAFVEPEFFPWLFSKSKSDQRF